ncbi:two pore domain potassium channel family protein [Flavobacterium sp. MDT1-60]|uniref:two pore domain potassium channel family protein n=1 Tax=Flavobacterium sp. MDT1-60 TaxID=1979344 RepID=UPI001782ECF9|nr:two pore domain potassium channel family protein [Flavobacterium sp. MDT1-60]QOG01317.1 two pore domain potassium channel family protein [Flavobacterium sp. MDT1-60]
MMKLKKDRFLYRLWTQESGLSIMLLLLCIMHFVVIPLFGSYTRFMIVVNIFWMLFIIAGIISLARNKRQVLRISVIPFLFLMVQWIDFFQTNVIVVFADLFFSIAIMLLLIGLVLVKVLEPGPVTAYRIIGSIVVYMLLVNLWCTVYLFLFKHIEGSFQIAVSPFEISSDQANFMYFSYITITSTGYGEIVPLHPLARSLVQMEVLTGVLYPVILIGRLVSDANFSLKK